MANGITGGIGAAAGGGGGGAPQVRVAVDIVPLSAAALHAVLLHTFAADQDQRKAAEAQLAALCHAPECLMLLLQIVVEPQVIQGSRPNQRARARV